MKIFVTDAVKVTKDEIGGMVIQIDDKYLNVELSEGESLSALGITTIGKNTPITHVKCRDGKLFVEQLERIGKVSYEWLIKQNE